MKLNHTLGELNNNDFEEYGEWLYFITVMGTPSATEPWGWQLDGHHLIINYFVLGDQVVMTPTFVGSEPVIAEAGKYKGTAILQDEQRQGLAFLRSLTDAQRAKAIVSVSKDGNNNIGEAFKDNVVLDYAGVRATDLSAHSARTLLSLVAAYVGNMDDGHARVKMTEVQAHLDDTYFAWIGGTDDTRVLLPDPQPGHPDRVRSPAPGGPAPSLPGRSADAAARARRDAHAQRQRLRQGPAAAALRGAPARPVPRARAAEAARALLRVRPYLRRPDPSTRLSRRRNARTAASSALIRDSRIRAKLRSTTLPFR